MERKELNMRVSRTMIMIFQLVDKVIECGRLSRETGVTRSIQVSVFILLSTGNTLSKLATIIQLCM